MGLFCLATLLVDSIIWQVLLLYVLHTPSNRSTLVCWLPGLLAVLAAEEQLCLTDLDSMDKTGDTSP